MGQQFGLIFFLVLTFALGNAWVLDKFFKKTLKVQILKIGRNETYSNNGTKVEKRNEPDIYCYNKVEANISNPFLIYEVMINLTSDKYHVYYGENSTEVIENFMKDHAILSLNMNFFRRRHIRLNPFISSCFGLVTQDDYHFTVDVSPLNVHHAYAFFCGLLLFIAAHILARDHVVFYLFGTVIGVLFSIVICLYFLASTVLPVKGLTITTAVLGTFLPFAGMYVWETLCTLLFAHQQIVLGYIGLSALVSFVFCYRIGPPTNPQSLNLIKWGLQIVGAGMMYMSSFNKQAIVTLMVIMFISYLFPKILSTPINFLSSLIVLIPSLMIKVPIFIIREGIVKPIRILCGAVKRAFVWLLVRLRLKNRPPPANWQMLISVEEYQERGEIETYIAMEEMREYYLNSPPGTNPFRALARMSEEARERTIRFLANEQEHIDDDEYYAHQNAFAISSDESDFDD